MPDGTSALVLAIINAHYELAAVLVDRGADPNADAQGWTALHQIAWTRRPNGGLANLRPVPTGTLDSLSWSGGCWSMARIPTHGSRRIATWVSTTATT